MITKKSDLFASRLTQKDREQILELETRINKALAEGYTRGRKVEVPMDFAVLPRCVIDEIGRRCEEAGFKVEECRSPRREFFLVIS